MSVRRWTPTSWETRPNRQPVHYEDQAALSEALADLARLPPLVTSWEIERLRSLIADAQQGRRFLVQGGDCAEVFDDCRASVITNKLQILLQLALLLVHGCRRPVVCVARLAGQYAKPRSRPTEIRGGVELPAYFGDLVNGIEFTPAARRPDPRRLTAAYQHAAMTMNFVRSLSAGGFADVRHPEYWEPDYFKNASLPPRVREDYLRLTREVADALRFMEAFSERDLDEATRVDFYASHECLHLDYEAAHTKEVAAHYGVYDLSTHFPWIGERTRQLDGAHVEFCRGIRNPVGVKLGPLVQPLEAVQLVRRLNPENEPGKIALITRLGVDRVEAVLPPLVEAVRGAHLSVLWMTDPMHGNTQITPSGRKTRWFEDIAGEIERSFGVHRAHGTHLGGVHLELTGEAVTECIGGAAAIEIDDIGSKYTTVCDPRLNRLQALELGLRIARNMRDSAESHHVEPALTDGVESSRC